MTDINALIFALAFTMAFMLLIGAYTRIELKKEPVHIYRTRLQQAFYVVTQSTVVITTTLLLSLSWCAALDSGSFAYALLMLHGLRAKYALAINLIILLNFQSMLHCILCRNRITSFMYYMHIVNFIMLVTPATIYIISGP